jgi:hypothetical protein
MNSNLIPQYFHILEVTQSQSVPIQNLSQLNTQLLNTGAITLLLGMLIAFETEGALNSGKSKVHG